MRILVTGAAGMLGRKLAERLARDGKVGSEAIEAVLLQDVVAAPLVAGLPAEVRVSDLAAPGEGEALAGFRPDLVFHLAGVVSGQAERDFALGYRVNLDGTRALFEALAAGGRRPRVVFTSSMAVFGAPLPAVVPDGFTPAPLTSYGTQKLMGELLLADHTRKGFIDGVGIRLPTVCVRPGKPNAAASGFFSGIIREPLAGQTAVLPVPREVVHAHASPRAAVGFLLHAATLDGDRLGHARSLNMPATAVSVGEQIEALRRVGGDRAVALIREEPDPAVWAIVRTWPERFEATRAEKLGFAADRDFDAIVRAHVEDELGGVA
ncbi:MAG: NAD-dependent epimerase [Mesorhizobium amorphae]|nr:MAG: NAD-dependent epimerase [Mesorhizobium amorphae]